MHPVGIPCAKLRTKFEFSSSNSFEDILDRLPKNLEVTWFKPRSFWGKLFVRPVRFSQTNLCTKLEVCTLSSFEDMFDCMPKILGSRDLGHAPLGKLFMRPVRFSKTKLCAKFEVCSLSSFEDMFDCMPKILGVTWPRPRPFWGKLFTHPARVFQGEAVYQIWSL